MADTPVSTSGWMIRPKSHRVEQESGVGNPFVSNSPVPPLHGTRGFAARACQHSRLLAIDLIVFLS
jgi:hypothetical protein